MVAGKQNQPETVCVVEFCLDSHRTGYHPVGCLVQHSRRSMALVPVPSKMLLDSLSLRRPRHQTSAISHSHTVMTSVLCGCHTAHPTELQYCCNLEIASWNVSPFLETPSSKTWTFLSSCETAETSAEGSDPAQHPRISLRLHTEGAGLAVGLLCAGTPLS